MWLSSVILVWATSTCTITILSVLTRGVKEFQLIFTILGSAKFSLQCPFVTKLFMRPTIHTWLAKSTWHCCSSSSACR